MPNLIGLILGNFGLAMLALAVLMILINCLVDRQLSFFEISFRWLSLLPLGVTAIYAFAMHAFFPNFTAEQIGWQNSPFQFEVAMANLGFGVIAILAFKASFGFRLATVIGNTLWLWGDALGHAAQILVARNYTIGNAGSWFWMDILMPLLLIICLIFIDHKSGLKRQTSLEINHTRG
ncbi:Uncharacterised protein [Legionella lansingensis]|uniref:Uncharacterized protein n=1 Tax=Legionella lansingensis TaxID=45067 RepID=A0A0W0VMX3_9GAMM|nr:DUF6790 family protein [Legionella lansingensis]KTD21531.1 hypothetical protein Llan_1549 [Legionella lansingensis]SNV52540.1 Uncharacterised protein [Legionella lansingensis]